MALSPIILQTSAYANNTLSSEIKEDQPTIKNQTNTVDGTKQSRDFDVPLIGTKTPLSSDSNSNEAWTLMNLILAVLGAALAVITTTKTLFDGRQGNKSESGTKLSEREKKIRLSKAISAIAVIALGAFGGVLFARTQNLAASMVFYDSWTPLNLALVIFEAIGMWLAFGGDNHSAKNVNTP